MSQTQPITADDLAAFSADFHAERASVVARNAVTSSGIHAAARVPEAVAAKRHDL